jgi:hypothetical protein
MSSFLIKVGGMIVGIAGKKGVGKSTLANYLVDKGFFYPASFAAPLKQMVRVLLQEIGVAGVDINAAEQDKEAIIDKIGESYRTLLQTLGTDWGRNLNSDIWLLCAEHRLKRLYQANIIFDDLRFANEADFIRERGGLIIHLGRDTGLTDNHISELGVKRQPGDFCLYNNNTLDELFAAMHSALAKHYGYLA